MLTPEGTNADNMDAIMLSSLWVKKLKSERENSNNNNYIIAASMGDPTYPIDPSITETELDYWKKLDKSAKEAEEISKKITNYPSIYGSNQVFKSEITNSIVNQIVNMEAVCGYGHPQGDLEARKIMAEALTNWYNVKISHENILFTTGDSGALRAVFQTINKTQEGFIVTTAPYYGLYKVDNRLRTINVMKEKGYKLTAQALEKELFAIEEDKKYGGNGISAFLFCVPHNPTGRTHNEEEWKEIAKVLRNYPKVPIIIDEAYAGLVLTPDYISLLQVAPDLKERLIILRTSTKDLSSAGLRQAVAVIFNKDMMTNVLSANIDNYGHAHRPSQLSYAVAMKNTSKEELARKAKFYGSQVKLVIEQLKQMGAQMPDPDYNVDGTFYVLCDFSDLIGMPVPEEAKRALGNDKTIIKTDIDISYYLLFKYGVSIAPLSAYGITAEKGCMRITCSRGPKILNELMARLKTSLAQARKVKITKLMSDIKNHIAVINKLHTTESELFESKLNQIIPNNAPVNPDPLESKQKISELQILISDIVKKISFLEYRTKSAICIQKNFRGHLSRRRISLAESRKQWAETYLSDFSNYKGQFLTSTAAERKKLPIWQYYLKNPKPSIYLMPEENTNKRIKPNPKDDVKTNNKINLNTLKI